MTNLTTIYTNLKNQISSKIQSISVFDPLNIPIYITKTNLTTATTRCYTLYSGTNTTTALTIQRGNYALINNINALNPNTSNPLTSPNVFINSYSSFNSNLKINNNKVEKLILNDQFQNFNDGLFSDCVNLKEINIPSNLTYIGKSVFPGSLKSIYAPYNIQPIITHEYPGLKDLIKPVCYENNIYHYDNGTQATNQTDFTSQLNKLGYTYYGRISDSVMLNDTFENKTLLIPNVLNTSFIVKNTDINNINAQFNSEIDNIISHCPNIKLLGINEVYSGINQRYILLEKYKNIQLNFMKDTEIKCFLECPTTQNQMTLLSQKTVICNFTRYNSSDFTDFINSNVKSIYLNNLMCVGENDKKFKIPASSFFSKFTTINNRITIYLNKGFKSEDNIYFNTYENLEFNFEDLNDKFNLLYPHSDITTYSFTNNETFEMKFMNIQTLSNNLTHSYNTLIVPNLTVLNGNDIRSSDNSNVFTSFITNINGLEKIYVNTSVYSAMSAIMNEKFPNITFNNVDIPWS